MGGYQGSDGESNDLPRDFGGELYNKAPKKSRDLDPDSLEYIIGRVQESSVAKSNAAKQEKHYGLLEKISKSVAGTSFGAFITEGVFISAYHIPISNPLYGLPAAGLATTFIFSAFLFMPMYALGRYRYKEEKEMYSKRLLEYLDMWRTASEK